jgi:hypothetical protein
MFTTTRCCVAVLFVAASVSLLSAGSAQAQASRRPSVLSVLQQQNALQQQQNAVQTAAQQTTALVQAAYQGNAAQIAIYFQQQQNALQIALQQATGLLQTSYRQNGALSKTALGQLNTLQTAQQQSLTLQNTLLSQGGLLTQPQLQILLQEQNALLGLLAVQPLSPQRRPSDR